MGLGLDQSWMTNGIGTRWVSARQRQPFMIISFVSMIARKLKAVLPRSVRRPLGATRRWLRALRSRSHKQKKRLLASGTLAPDERDLLSRAESKISYQDGMYTGDGDRYFRIGLSAIQCLNDALSNAHIESPANILDLPCGYGRVLRFLVHRFPGATITACELDPDAVRFCAETFGALPVRSSENFDQLSFDTQFDLIWCGSLATHLNQDGIAALLRLFRRLLAPEGIVVLSTHGDRVIDRMLARDFDYAIAREQIPPIVDAYRAIGFAFTNYPEVTSYGVAAASGYGVSLTAPEWIRAQAAKVGGLHEIFFRAQGWDNHQDVFGFVRSSAP
jgi:SAM-dependent methyltransferase